ncbi:FecCD family ABC transporter permease [Paenibacillus camelliae]|uniref:FecCD family ABC transporter permease n=1 Tax=Paenibacillus camelliae TaxID=512410 RepID=UPI002040A01C|nr:iron chelate uptake ABC transporter family permease subunit [Paenibacillus camelliae]MCM3634844.1 iron chelate uptake ABC transporter family permease subunit [Paenibacillus camelliae]
MKIHSIDYVIAGRLQRRRRWMLVTALLAALACCLCVAVLLLGNTFYPLPVVISVLMGEEIKGATFAIETIRLPRMLAGLFAGFAFGIAGYVFQTILRNPLANPNVIGITSGSSAAAVYCIIVLQSSKAVISIASVAAGLVTVVVIYMLARVGGNTFSIGRLVLVGIGIQAMCNSIVTYLLLIGKEHDLPAAIRWITGSLNGVKLDELPVLMISSFILVPLIYILGRPLMMLELGEQMATTLGVRTDLTRVLLIVSAVFLVAIATSITGPIASIALLSGPIANRLVGAGNSNSIAAGLVGANIVLAADLIGQFAFTTKYPAGIITAIIGAPYLLLLLIQMNRRGDF